MITGNLTRDAEVRMTQSGTAVANIGVAVNDKIKNSSTGVWEDYPNYINCVMFGRRAEGLQSYLTKGTKVAIEGKLRWSQWEQDGQKRNKLEVIIDEIDLMSRNNSGGQPDVSSYSAPETPVVDASESVYSEDVPF